VLIFANKQDLPKSMSVVELTDKLNLSTILKGRRWGIQVFASCMASIPQLTVPFSQVCVGPDWRWSL
jgi:signal recognition particle receptor subunit beta